MITICWNCREIGAASTVKELKDLTSKFKPQMAFLSETKAKASKLMNLKRRLNFDDMYAVDCISSGKSGGLCLFWNRCTKVDVLHSDSNVIHTFVSIMNTNVNFYYSFMYGNSVSQQKRLFWEKLRHLHLHNHEPWIYAGDFNELLCQSEKSRIRIHRRSQMQCFKDFLFGKEMEEFPQSGSKHIWCNHYKKIDF